MTAATWILLCGVHSMGFAVFHLAFWKLFDWPRSLQSTTPANRAVIQILNLRLAYVFLGVAAACFVLPAELSGTPLGRALLWFMLFFWIGRAIEQAVFLRVNHRMVHVLTALFVIGAVLFAMALVA